MKDCVDPLEAISLIMEDIHSVAEPPEELCEVLVRNLVSVYFGRIFEKGIIMEYNSVEEFTKDLYEDGLDNSSLVNFVEELFSVIENLKSYNAELRYNLDILSSKAYLREAEVIERAADLVSSTIDKWDPSLDYDYALREYANNLRKQSCV